MLEEEERGSAIYRGGTEEPSDLNDEGVKKFDRPLVTNGIQPMDAHPRARSLPRSQFLSIYLFISCF